MCTKKLRSTGVCILRSPPSSPSRPVIHLYAWSVQILLSAYLRRTPRLPFSHFMFDIHEIRFVARRAMAIFASHGLVSCLFGSTACALYGCSRSPNDVDIIVMTNTHTQEELKRLLVQYPESEFYIRPSRKIGATYMIVYCTVGEERFCKIDILIPGVLNIPHIAPGRIVHIDELPVLPFMALLLMKLQGWSDHRGSGRSDMWEKQYVDVRDINQMLGIAATRGEDVNKETWLPKEFLDAARVRVVRYVEHFRQPSRWERIGFVVAPENAPAE